jgi:hypothetical protein
MSELIDFPFDREKRYPITDLNRFLERITQTHHLSEAIRARSLPWAKLWCEELLPIKLFADHNHVSEKTDFKIMAEGDPVDVQLCSSDSITCFQITLAYPDWDGGTGKRRNPGYVASMERVGIDQKIPTFLGGDITKSSTGQLISAPRARPTDVDIVAWESGLRSAIAEKLSKADRYAGIVDVLLVYASRLRFHSTYVETASIVVPVIKAVLSEFSNPIFKKIAVVDDDQLGYVEYTL